MNNNTTSYITNIRITGLEPGTNYMFAVSAVAADNKTEGSLVKVSTCTGKFHMIKCESEMCKYLDTFEHTHCNLRDINNM